MITTDKERRICGKYGAYDVNGKVHCYECPLVKGDPKSYDFRCKANSSYDRSLREWVYDEVTE